MPPPYKLAQFTLTTTDWTPIVPPSNADQFTVDNLAGPDDILLTDDPATGVNVVVYVGNQWILPPSHPWSRAIRQRIRAGATCGYLKSTSSSPRVVNVSFT